MGKVPVYKFAVYDITTDADRVSRRMGTRVAIERLNGRIIEGTEREIDETELGREIAGLTDCDVFVSSDGHVTGPRSASNPHAG